MPAPSSPLGKHFEFNPYYEHQNNTGKKPNKQVHGYRADVEYLFFEESPLSSRNAELADSLLSGRHPD